MQVKGWIVDELGVIKEASLVRTESPKIFIQYAYSSGLNLLAGVGIPIYSPETPHKHYLLNDTFFTDERLALRKSSENARSYQGELYKRIEANYLRVKEIEKREKIMNIEKREAEEKALVDAANKKLLTDIAPKPYDLGRGVYFTNEGCSKCKGTIIAQYTEGLVHPAYDIKMLGGDVVRVQHSEIYLLERGTCK